MILLTHRRSTFGRQLWYVLTFHIPFQRLCPIFAMLECLPAITLSIALILAAVKTAIILDTFGVKRYVNTRTCCIALSTIIVSKVNT